MKRALTVLEGETEIKESERKNELWEEVLKGSYSLQDEPQASL